jgi:hypothetical protein
MAVSKAFAPDAPIVVTGHQTRQPLRGVSLALFSDHRVIWQLVRPSGL